MLPRHAIAPAVLLIAAAGCATTEPFSYLDGGRWLKAEMNTYDTVIVAVDGSSYTYNSRIRVDPGPHTILLRAPPAAGFHDGVEKALEVNVEPCTRYWFEAKKVNRLDQDFEPRINYKEPIAGCGSAGGKG
jgi:hypothetical protein